MTHLRRSSRVIFFPFVWSWPTVPAVLRAPEPPGGPACARQPQPWDADEGSGGHFIQDTPHGRIEDDDDNLASPSCDRLPIAFAALTALMGWRSE